MALPALPSGLYPEDYERIEAAVMETARGRWFLLEYARRQRVGETERLARAIERLERRLESVDESRAAPALGPIEAPIEPAASVAAPSGAERRAQRIGERLQDFAWFLRERGLDERVCAEIDDLARRAAELAETPARFAETGAETVPPEAPPLVSRSHPPESVGKGDDGFAAARDGAPRLPALPCFTAGPIEPQPDDAGSPTCGVVTVDESGTTEESGSRGSPLPPADRRLIAFSRLDNLSIAEKLAFFA